eukprot:2814543-Rhodomonas_salina.1
MPDTSDTALLSAARYLRTRILDALITAGADVNAADSDGMTAIFLARRGLCNCAMQELREWGQSTDATELAARQEECVLVLLEAGADPLDQVLRHCAACVVVSVSVCECVCVPVCPCARVPVCPCARVPVPVR